VTHDVGLVRRFCDRAMLIEKHRIDAIGAPDDIARRYLDVNFLGSETVGAEPTVAERAQIREVWVSDERGERTTMTSFGQQIRICALVEAHAQLSDPEVRIQVENEAGVRVFAASTLEFDHPVDDFAPGEQRVFTVRLENRLVSATYVVNVLVRSRTQPEDVSAVQTNAARFAVVGGDHVGGIYDIDHEVALESVPAGVRT
jgi:ABC-type glutathione transport system ATPase component